MNKFKKGDVVYWIWKNKQVGDAIVLREDNNSKLVLFQAWVIRPPAIKREPSWSQYGAWQLPSNDHEGIEFANVRHHTPEDAERIFAEFTAAQLTDEVVRR